MVGNDVKSRPVELGGQVLGGHGEANHIRNSLAEWSSGHLDALVLDLGVSWAKRIFSCRVVGLELIECHRLVSRKVEEGVLE